jgi:predicted DNA-binding ribbon-helix-helix protein
MAGSICIEAVRCRFGFGGYLSPLYHPPVKRSITVAGHQTSISLEPGFWDALKAAADMRQVPLNALVAEIDVERLRSPTPCGLASAIRLWLLAEQDKKVPLA